MSGPEALPSLRVRLLDRHIRITESDRLGLLTLLGVDHKLLCAIAGFSFSDPSGGVVLSWDSFCH